MVDTNGSRTYLNPMAEDHARMTSSTIRSYLDTKLAGSYSYRLEASWYPVAGYTIGSNIVIGDESPQDAIIQRAKITIPLSYTTSRSSILETMNDTMLMEALNETSRENKQTSIRDGFNRTIDVAALEAARQISASVFPATYLKSIISSNGDFQGGGDWVDNDEEIIIISCMLDNTANNLMGMNITVPENKLSLELVALIENEVTAELQNTIDSHLKSKMAYEINCTAS